MIDIEIDRQSGFCFGVVSAIKRAEQELEKGKQLFCLGDIVHNSAEVKRLSDKGLKVISHEEFKHLQHEKVLIRAHGEPPETYLIAKQNGIELIDATCPIVLKLQQKIAQGHEEMEQCTGQVLIYGKKGHAEVVGLEGQTNNKALVVTHEEDLNKMDANRPVRLYSQTTMAKEGYDRMIALIKQRLQNDNFTAFDTICNQVSNRTTHIVEFTKRFEVVVFVSGKNSSNGQYLYKLCKDTNPNTYFISEAYELKKEWFAHIQHVGICGATSTPMWLMEDIRKAILAMILEPDVN